MYTNNEYSYGYDVRLLLKEAGEKKGKMKFREIILKFLGHYKDGRKRTFIRTDEKCGVGP